MMSDRDGLRETEPRESMPIANLDDDDDIFFLIITNFFYLLPLSTWRFIVFLSILYTKFTVETPSDTCRALFKKKRKTERQYVAVVN